MTPTDYIRQILESDDIDKHSHEQSLEIANRYVDSIVDYLNMHDEKDADKIFRIAGFCGCVSSTFLAAAYAMLEALVGPRNAAQAIEQLMKDHREFLNFKLKKAGANDERN